MRWTGKYPRNNGDPQNDCDEPQDKPDHEDNMIRHQEEHREHRIERDNDRW